MAHFVSLRGTDFLVNPSLAKELFKLDINFLKNEDEISFDFDALLGSPLPFDLIHNDSNTHFYIKIKAGTKKRVTKELYEALVASESSGLNESSEATGVVTIPEKSVDLLLSELDIAERMIEELRKRLHDELLGEPRRPDLTQEELEDHLRRALTRIRNARKIVRIPQDTVAAQANSKKRKELADEADRITEQINFQHILRDKKIQTINAIESELANSHSNEFNSGVVQSKHAGSQCTPSSVESNTAKNDLIDRILADTGPSSPSFK